MTPQERILRRRIRSLLNAWRPVSFMAWHTPVTRFEPYLEVSKTLIRSMDRQADKARAAIAKAEGRMQ